MPRSENVNRKLYGANEHLEIGFMVLKEIGTEMIFDTPKIQLRFRPKLPNCRKKSPKINGTLRGLWFFIRINPEVVLG